MDTPDTKPTVLIIDDERNTREGLARALRRQYRILTADNGVKGLETLDSEDVDVVLTDLRMPLMDGMAFIRRATSRGNAPLVIMLTAYGTVQNAIQAMREGAYDYLMKPVDLDNLEMVIERGLESRALRRENEALRQELDERFGFEGVVGESAPMLEVMDMVRQIAPARSTVLLTGESGTGKELIAHALHQLSPRAGKPFIAVHCAALNSSLLESELFGHEKGAFTGAHARQQGRFERANGGTIFLDEVGEVDPATQVKLLRVLESRSFERVGGGDTLEVDVRVITATNRDLKGMVEAGTFREDLYYRLAVMHIHLPALRERIADLPLLLNYFLSRFCEENAKKLNGFSKEALKVLSAYAWPGNIRELRNCVERMVVMARGTSLTLSDVPREIRTAVAESLPAQASPGTADTVSAVDDAPLQRSGTPTADASGSLDMEQAARQLIIQALKECDGNRTLAARKLGISRRTLHRKINIYGLGDL